MSEPRMSEGARALLRAYDERHAMPSGAEDRIAQRLAATIADARAPVDAASVVPLRRRGRAAITVALLAAAAAFLLWWLLPHTRRVVADADVTPMSAPHEVSDRSNERAATLRSPTEAAAAAASDPHEAVAPPEPAPVPLVRPDPEVADEAEPDATTKTPRPAVARRDAAIEPEPEPEPAVSLTEDAKVLGRAQAALRMGEAASALTHLAEHARRFPGSALAEERAALRVLALCEAGRREEASREREAFLQKYPHSPSRSRVSKACAEAQP